MSIKKMVSWMLCVVVLLMASACSMQKSETPSKSTAPLVVEYPTTINNITIAQQPRRVIVMSSALAEIIVDMGYEAVIVGTSDGCEYPASVQKKPKLGSVQLPKLNDIAALGADLILSTAPFVEEDLIKIQQLDIPVLTLQKPNTIDEIKGFYTNIAKILTGQTSGVTKADQFHQIQMDKLDHIVSVTTTYTTSTQKKKGIYLYELDMILATGDTFVGKTLEKIGIENLAQPFTEYTIPEKEREKISPEVIFYNSELDEQAIIKNKFYKSSSAIKTKALFAVNEKALASYSIRMFDELEKMAKNVYPQAFANAVSTPSETPSSSSDLKETSSTKSV